MEEKELTAPYIKVEGTNEHDKSEILITVQKDMAEKNNSPIYWINKDLPDALNTLCCLLEPARDSFPMRKEVDYSVDLSNLDNEEYPLQEVVSFTSAAEKIINNRNQWATAYNQVIQDKKDALSKQENEHARNLERLTIDLQKGLKDLLNGFCD